jgi:phosphatidylglycerophosphatase A
LRSPFSVAEVDRLLNFLVTLIGTFGFSGFFPIAPATFASLIFCLLYVFVPGGEVIANPIVAVITLIISVPVSTRLEHKHGHDASCIVIDEVVGMQAILVAAQPTVLGVVIAFFVFRVFDIVKPFPAAHAQELPNGFGVVADDVMAGLYSRLVMIVLAALWSGAGDFLAF